LVQEIFAREFRGHQREGEAVFICPACLGGGRSWCETCWGLYRGAV